MPLVSIEMIGRSFIGPDAPPPPCSGAISGLRSSQWIVPSSGSDSGRSNKQRRGGRNHGLLSTGDAVVGASLPLIARRRVGRLCSGVGDGQATEEGGDGEGTDSARHGLVRTLFIDNYDSYSYNIYQELSVVNGLPPVVVRNDEWTWDHIQHCLYEEEAFDNIVISPGPGSPTCPADIGICLTILLECKDIPILGVCLGHQALGYVHGAQIVHAPEPVHGRLSEIEHAGCNLFNEIPSGRKSGFKVVRYHSLVVDADSLPKELIPIAWTTSNDALSFLETEESDNVPITFGNGKNQPLSIGRIADNRKNLRSSFNNSKYVESKKVLMGIMHCTRPHYGVQFHPESIATCHGRQIFENFKKMTINHGLRSPLFMKERFTIVASGAHRIFKGLQESKRLVNNLVKGQHIGMGRNVMVEPENRDTKHLKLRWRKFDGLANQVGGSGNIFFSLFGDQNAEDTFWLDSSSTEQRRARFSFMGGKGGSLWKQFTFWSSDQRFEHNMTAKGGGYLSTQDADGSVKTVFLKDGFLDFLNKELRSFHYDREDYEALPFNFCGGFVGFIGYGLKVECGASSNRHKSMMPDACFFFADNLIVIDHSNGDVYILSIHDICHQKMNVGPCETSYMTSWLDATQKRLLGLKTINTKKLNDKNSRAGLSNSCKPRFVGEKSRCEYIKDVERCLKFIRDGESYELCLTTQMRMRVKDINALGLYHDLRNQNPAPYAAWLNFSKEDLCICCSSPERFLQLDGNGTLEAKPIKGTIARGTTMEEDEHLKFQLQHSEKDQAENLMIVDLLRNDLGRVCEPGTVQVPHLMEVQSYATVHTLVSTIRGKKMSNLSPIDCVKAAFPGGSMTGAPKLRSMELLETLESCSRGVYSGSIGFFSYNQTFDLNIVIRTVVIHAEEASIGAGGAIVALSNPEDEFEEMMLKASVPARVVGKYPRKSDFDSMGAASWSESCGSTPLSLD